MPVAIFGEKKKVPKFRHISKYRRVGSGVNRISLSKKKQNSIDVHSLTERKNLDLLPCDLSSNKSQKSTE